MRAIGARARTEAQAAFEAALRRQGLEPIELPERTVTIGGGPGSPPPLPGRAAASGRAVERTVDGHRGLYVAGPRFWTGDATHPDSWELARAADGSIVRVIRRPERRTQRVQVCGCEPRECRYGSPCPACHPSVQRFYGPLPPGARYAGTREIAYSAPTVELRWEDGSCNQVCGPPPP